MQRNPADYTHIIWDWNGTLLDDAAICLNIMNTLLTQNQLAPLTPQRYEDAFTFPVKNYYQAIGYDFLKTPFELISDQFIHAYEQQKYDAPLQPYAREVLQHFQNAGIAQSIISASQQESLTQMVQNHHLTDFFLTWRGLDNHHAASKIEIGHQWQQEFAHPNDKILLIGDTIHDLELAQALGIDAILLYSHHQSLDRLKKAHPYVINNLQALI